MKITHFFTAVFLILAVGTVMISLNSCYPGETLTVSEVDIVATDYDDNYFNTKNPTSYHLPDTLSAIGGGDPNVSEGAEQLILNQIHDNLVNKYGWQRIDVIDENNLPDVIVTASAIQVTTSVSGCIPWWGGWGWYPWYPGWGWGGGWCYPTYLYSYDTGTIVMDMVDPNEGGVESFGLVWHGGINGLLRSTSAGNENFVRTNIDQAFDQSPYLKR
jgi:hypothetical protein